MSVDRYEYSNATTEVGMSASMIFERGAMLAYLLSGDPFEALLEQSP